MTGATPYRLFKVRLAPPDEGVAITTLTHFVASEDEALEAAARQLGFTSYRDWQHAHPEWIVSVEAGDRD